MAADENLLLRWSEWGISAIGGALVTAITFRTKFALMDRELKAHRADIDAAKVAAATALAQTEEKLYNRLDLLERKQGLILEIIVDIARKVGVDARFSDVVLKFLNDDIPTRPSRGDT